MTASGYRRFLLVPGLLVLVIVLNVRVVFSGRENLQTARQCAEIGLFDTAIDFYARSARWYTPFSTTSSDAIEGLLEVARGSRARNDTKTALKALREARGAILGTRWLLTPGSEHLPAINLGIARLMADGASPGAPAGDVDANLALLEKTTLPNPWVSLLTTLLFVAWIPVTVIGASRVVTAGGRFAGRTGIVWMALSAGLLCGWLLLLALA